MPGKGKTVRAYSPEGVLHFDQWVAGSKTRHKENLWFSTALMFPLEVKSGVRDRRAQLDGKTAQVTHMTYVRKVSQSFYSAQVQREKVSFRGKQI